LEPELLICFQNHNVIKGHFVKIQEDVKAGLKAFFDKANAVIEFLLPSGLVTKLREKISDIFQVMEGLYQPIEKAYVREVQLSKLGDEK